MNVVVTGGTGFVGKRLAKVRPDWIYLSSKDYDLVSTKDCKKMYQELRPDAVVHLAAKTGGIKASVANPAEFYYLNTMINANVIHQGYLHGVKRILAALSTCTFPDVAGSYPLTEDDILSGPPAKTNLSYGYSKRSLHIQINSYREQYGLDYSTFCPSNIYGPEDNFDDDESHFVAAMIKKITLAENGDEVEFFGSGAPLRQELYIDDLAKIISILLEVHHSDSPIIVAPYENFSIKQMVQMCIEVSGKEIKPFFNGKLSGQYRKDGNNKKLLETIGDFKFTTFKKGIEKTYEWYEKQ